MLSVSLMIQRHSGGRYSRISTPPTHMFGCCMLARS